MVTFIISEGIFSMQKIFEKGELLSWKWYYFYETSILKCLDYLMY